MSSDYIELYEKATEIEGRLEICAKSLEGIKPEERANYENPQYRMWSGHIKDLEEFIVGVEEWVSQPPVAEARRYLSDLRKWAESIKEVSLKEVEKDWRFLSDNVEEIKEIYEKAKAIGYESIKKRTSVWILERIAEKDVERAKNWATNANEFADSLKQLEDKEAESKLAGKVKRDAIEELLKTTSFDKDSKETVNKYEELIDKAETIVRDKPAEINEKALLTSYRKDEGIKESISTIGTEIGNIRTILIDLEWVKEFAISEDYNELWDEKQTAIKEKALESIARALRSTQQKAKEWKEACRKEIDGKFIRIERMSKSLDKDSLKTSLEEEIRRISWDKPDLEYLSGVLSKTDGLREQLRENLVKELQNEEAITMIEEPEVIEDLGRKKGWDFGGFIQALGIVLEKGLIEIKAVEEE